jgi:predicted nucleic acid-binding protein
VSACYLDTSAAAKLLVEEPESEALARWVDADPRELVGTLLVETELRRLAVRHEVSQAAVSDLLDRITLFDLEPSVFHQAGVLPGRDLRTLDALHLVGALRIGVRTLVTYDGRMSAAAAGLGLEVVAPA